MNRDGYMDAHAKIQPVPYASRSRWHPLSVWLDSMLARIADSQQQTRVVATLISVYVLVWTAYGAIAKSSQDIHFDMGETLVWFRQSWFSTPKHPPLSAWLPGLWFEVLPRQDWAFYLLAMILSGVALASAWLIARDYLQADKLAIALPLLTFVPFYNFHALKFNANTVMVPLWGLASLAFLRSFQHRTAGWAALAGLAAAAVMLGKYWGVFLLAGFFVAAVLDPRRAAYFRSPAPWISMGVGFVALMPHLATVVADPGSVAYALQSHVIAWYTPLIGAPHYLGGIAAYLAVPLLVFAGLAWRRRNVLADTIVPSDPDRRLATTILLVPILLPLAVAPLAASEINALWTMGGYAFLPVVLLSSPGIHLSRQAARAILAAAMVFPLVLLLASPGIALTSHLKRKTLHDAQAQLLASEVERRWAAATPSTFRQLAGVTSIINAVAFYMDRVPTTLDVLRSYETPWINDDKIRRDGIAFICETDDPLCMHRAEQRAQPFSPLAPEVFTLSRRFLGFDGARQSYTLTIVLPQTSDSR